MKIIDSHVHFPVNPDAGTWHHMIAVANRYGIGKLIVSNVFCGQSYPTQEELHEGNLYCLEAMRSSEGQLAALVYLNPQLPDWQQELADALQAGAVGVKLWISLKDEHGSLENTLSVLKQCAVIHLPVLIHVFNRTDGNLPGEINMEELLYLAKKVPNCTIIAAHTGYNLTVALPFIRECPQNVFFDICGGAPINGMLPRLLEVISPERILYGSDGMGRSFLSQLMKVFECKLSKENQEKILWKNAARLYHLSEPPEMECTACDLKAPERDFFAFAGEWPYGDLPENSFAQWIKLLTSENVKEVWAPSLEAVFAEKTTEANLSYLEQCQGMEHIRPLAVINPTQTTWRNDLCSAIAHDFTGIWLSPYVHNYGLWDRSFRYVLGICSEMHIPVFLNFCIADYRFRPAALNCHVVSENEMMQFFATVPTNTYIVQGASYVACAVSAGVYLYWVSNRTADNRNTIEEFPVLPTNTVWVQGSEYPFRPFLSCINDFPPGQGQGL